MKRFNDLLYVSRGIGEEKESLQQALMLTSSDRANLSILILYPVLPNDFADYKSSYEENLLSKIRNTIKEIITENNYDEEELQQYITYRIESCDSPVNRIIQHVLREEYDLVLKKSEKHDAQKGFKAIDMGLMRKCPAPVWLYYPGIQHSDIKNIAVAIDPESPEISGADLAEHLLKVANDLTIQLKASLTVISCWNYAYEETIRRNDFAEVPDDTLDKIVTDAKDVHLATLQTIISSSNIPDNFELHHVKGLPSTVIPDFVEKHNIDLLIMGTVARTGIPGFLMGNTAEDVLQKVNCTLLTFKPAGFVTPVKAF